MNVASKNILSILLLITGLTIIYSCSSDDEWNEMPSPVAQFVAHYFPEQGISDFGESDGIYHVKMKNGAALSFSSDYEWISVNGYGGTLPQVFLFDQLPPALYEYIQESNMLNNVYSVTRDSHHYTVALLDSSLIYEIKTGKIIESPTPTAPSQT